MFFLVVNTTSDLKKPEQINMEMIVHDVLLQTNHHADSHSIRIMQLDYYMRHKAPDFVLLEIDKGPNHGYRTLETIRAKLPNTQILAILHEEAQPNADIRAEQVGILNAIENVTAVDSVADLDEFNDILLTLIQDIADPQSMINANTPAP